jgi:hypothetical protein
MVEVLQTRIAHYLNFPVPQVRDAAPMLPISELPTAELQRLYAEFGSVLQSRANMENNEGAETENNGSRQHCRQWCRERLSSCLKTIWDGFTGGWLSSWFLCFVSRRVERSIS